ncbi:hypothetical protein EON65_27540 [archaeon]|nr:MAG: hypothetical protein EON65_27540 [archaeon]
MYGGGAISNDVFRGSSFEPGDFAWQAITSSSSSLSTSSYNLSVPYAEYNALEALYSSAHGKNWIWLLRQAGIPWDFSGQSDPCLNEWQGVICECQTTGPFVASSYAAMSGAGDRLFGSKSSSLSWIYNDGNNSSIANSSCTVIALHLPAHNITGPIPLEIGNLSNVQTVIFERNHITSPLPYTLPLLRNLTYLDLAQNHLWEVFPTWLCTLPVIQTLDLHDNFIRGNLSMECYNMTTLVDFNVASNFLDGTISDAIRNLALLRSFEIGSNLFSGTLPPAIQHMTNLSNLGFQLTSFDSDFPLWICNMTWLTGLQFGYNNYNGTFPSEIGNLKNLLSLRFDSNYYSGPFPEVLLTLTQLETLDMQFNLFTSTIPESISALRNLSVFYISGNLFDGSFPCAAINQLTNMSIFGARNMLVNGTLDGCFDALSNITYIEIDNNMVSGNLPQLSRSLISIIAYNNALTGPLPNVYPGEISTLHIRFYSVGNNYLSGTLPVELVISPLMSYLAVNDNFLNGSIDNLLPLSHSGLAQLFLENNLFTGTIPTVLANYSNLVEISLSGNYLTGTFPAVFNNLSYLAVLLIANNQLTGNLYNLYNPHTQPYVKDIDVSRNFFTGTIPGHFFHLPELTSFSAFSNCLHGTLPEDICQATALNSLVLDGVSTAHRCRRQIFPGSSSLKAFILDRSLGGTIPACIPSMPKLRTLQLAGNGLTGSLPPNMTVCQQLRDLTLSHNSLTGSIPSVLQLKFFPILDLSYNRFSGTLNSDFVSLTDVNTISLRDNRLSGNIPAAFKSTQHINVLEGNMFDCDASRSTLPENDPSRAIYICGSDELNNSVYSWCGVVGFVLVLCLYGVWSLYYNGKQHISGLFVSLRRLLASYTSLPDYISSSAPAEQQRSLSTLFSFYAYLRKLFLVLSLVLVIVLIPTHSSLTHTAHTYENQYGWSVSGVFLQGIVPSVVMLCLMGLFALVFVASVQYFVDRNGDFIKNSLASHREATVGNEMPKHSGDNSIRTGLWGKYGLLVFINLVAMACVDSSYIYIFLNFNASIVAATQIGMALVKIVWNEFVLWNLVAYMHVYSEAAGLDGINVFSLRWQLMSLYEYSMQDAWFVLVTTLLNNTVVPSVAIAFISSNCFYNAIIAAPIVTDSYYIYRCILYIVADSLSRPICAELKPTRLDISYDVPFQYSYQCASTIYINYIPVYVFMFVGVGLLLPLAKVCIHNYYHHYLQAKSGSHSSWQTWLRHMLPHLYTAPHIMFLPAAHQLDDAVMTKVMLPILMIAPTNVEQPGPMATQQQLEISPVDESLSRQSLPAEKHRSSRLSMCDVSIEEVRRSMQKQGGQHFEHQNHVSPLHPQSYKNNETSKSTSSTTTTVYRPPMLFQQEKVVVQIVNYLAILLCFGTVYPPLAAIACVSFAVQSWGNQYLLVSLLSRCWNIQQQQQQQQQQHTAALDTSSVAAQDVVGFYVEMLARQCRDVVPLFASLVSYVLPFFSLLVGYLIFDTAGYTGGWSQGLWCWVLFAAWPVAIIVLVCWFVNNVTGDLAKPKEAEESEAKVTSTTMSPITATVAGQEDGGLERHSNFGSTSRTPSGWLVAGPLRSLSRPSLPHHAGRLESKTLEQMDEL